MKVKAAQEAWDKNLGFLEVIDSSILIVKKTELRTELFSLGRSLLFNAPLWHKPSQN